MYLKVIQNQVGNFNIANPSQRTFTFSMGLFDEDGIIERNGIKARLSYSGEVEDECYFERPEESIEHIFDMCYKYANKTISTVPYEKQCLTFLRVYEQNLDEINREYKNRKTNKLQKKIDKLQEKINSVRSLPHLVYAVEDAIYKKIGKYKRWIKEERRKLSDIKEDTDRYKKLSERIEKWESDIKKLKHTFKDIVER